MKTQLIIIAISIIVGGFIGWSLKPDKDCPNTKPETVVEYRYIDKTDTLVVPKFRTIVKNDTISFRDTVFIHSETNYIAEVDTIYEDSSLTAKIQYVSPIPLSMESYFNLNFKIKEKVITNTIIETEEASFWDDRFIPYLGVGVSYDGEVIEPSIELGFGIRLN